MVKTGDKRAKNIKPGVAGKKTRFSKTNQPTNEQKSAGWAAKKTLKELLNLCLTGDNRNAVMIRNTVAKLLGIEPNDLKTMTFEEAMDLKQIQKAMTTGNTQSWKALKEQVYGQKVQVEGTQKIVVTVKKKE